MNDSVALSPAEIERFVEDGYVVLREGFPAAVADAIRDRIWQRMGLSPDDPDGWPAKVVFIKEVYAGAPFAQAYTPRVVGSFDQLVGCGRWIQDGWLGYWPVLFPGFAAPPWTAPEFGWHVDGGHFRRHPWSPERALLTLFLLSDIGPGDGGTAVSVGSHRMVAGLLAEAEPAGLTHGDLLARANSEPRAEVREVTGAAGDVVLLHPLLLHAQSENTGGRVRFIANPYLSAREPLAATGERASPVERAMRLADRVGAGRREVHP